MDKKNLLSRQFASMPDDLLIFNKGGGHGAIDATDLINIKNLTQYKSSSSFIFTGASMPDNETDIKINGIGRNLSLLNTDELYYGNITDLKISDANLKIIIYVG